MLTFILAFTQGPLPTSHHRRFTTSKQGQRGPPTVRKSQNINPGSSFASQGKVRGAPFEVRRLSRQLRLLPLRRRQRGRKCGGLHNRAHHSQEVSRPQKPPRGNGLQGSRVCHLRARVQHRQVQRGKIFC